MKWMRLSRREITKKVCFESSFVLLGLNGSDDHFFLYFSFSLYFFSPYAVFFRWRKKKLSRFIWLLNLLWLICWNSPNRMNKMKRQNEMIVYIWNCLTWISHEKSVREEVKRFVMLLQFFFSMSITELQF